MYELIKQVCWPTSEEKATDQLQADASNALLSQAESLVRGLIERLDQNAEKAMLDFVQQALCVMLRLKEMSPSLLTKIVCHPTFNYWVKAMRRCQKPEHQVHLHDLLPRAADFMWPFEVMTRTPSRTWNTLTDDKGGLRCPVLKCFVEFGPQWANSPVSITPEEHNVCILLGNYNINLPYDVFLDDLQDKPSMVYQHDEICVKVARAPTLSDKEIEVWSRDQWLRVHFTGTQQRQTGIELFGNDNDWFPESVDTEPYLHALILLQHYWPEAYSELGKFTQVIVPMVSKFETETRLAFTVSSRQGAIFIDGGKPYDLVDNILHETAHIKLRQIQLLDPLLVDAHQDQPRFEVPWRRDPRPLPGILEGIFVFSHVAEFERRMCESESLAKRDKLITTITNLKHGLKLLQQHAEMTMVGRVFLQEMADHIARIDLASAKKSA